MPFPVQNIEARLIRKKFWMGEWWFPKTDVYLLANPASKDPKNNLKALARAFRKEGVEIPTAYLPMRTHDGQVQPYACTNKRGAGIILGRLQGLRVKRLAWEANAPQICRKWKRQVDEAVENGRCRCELRGGEKWYALSDMIAAIRTYYAPGSSSSVATYMKRQNGLSLRYFPWGGADWYFKDRGKGGGSGFTYAVKESQLMEFFEALWEMREYHRKEVKPRAQRSY